MAWLAAELPGLQAAAPAGGGAAASSSARVPLHAQTEKTLPSRRCGRLAHLVDRQVAALEADRQDAAGLLGGEAPRRTSQAEPSVGKACLLARSARMAKPQCQPLGHHPTTSTSSRARSGVVVGHEAAAQLGGGLPAGTSRSRRHQLRPGRVGCLPCRSPPCRYRRSRNAPYSPCDVSSCYCHGADRREGTTPFGRILPHRRN